MCPKKGPPGQVGGELNRFASRVGVVGLARLGDGEILGPVRDVSYRIITPILKTLDQLRMLASY